MKKYFLVEALCVILVVCFIASTMKEDTVTLKTAKELSDEISNTISDDTLLERDSAFIRDKLELDTSAFSSISYYSSDDIMNVNELFIGVISDEKADSVLEKLKEYAEDKFNLFDGYAPEQAALLDSYIAEYVSGAVIFCVCDKSDQVYEAFRSVLK